MRTDEIATSLHTLFAELVNGAPATGAYVLNRGDAGLLASLDRLSAYDASAPRTGGATIAAHVEHLSYGLSLMNRWAAGEDPFTEARWAPSWKTTTVTDDQWTELRAGLRQEAERWLDNLAEPRETDEVGLNGMIGSVVHLAYHLGAMRQIDRALRGPEAND
ncbi:MAG TPA: hypothetical protein VMN78_13635 [Longimicrobiales bacterium]|nr:hypothetical protein [Longimicrobiales bacterium]